MKANFYLNPYLYMGSFAQKSTPQHAHNSQDSCRTKK